MTCYNNKFYASRNGVTNIVSRPNVIFADIRSRNEAADNDIARLLMKEEINVSRTYGSADTVRSLRGICPWGNWHMMIVRDGGLERSSFETLSEIRRFSDIPVLTVSDECSEIYKIMALNKGADACMEAGDSFCAFEFKARVVAMLRRFLSMRETSAAPETGDRLTNGGLTIDRRRREVFSDGVKIRMTAIEYGIVEYLMENCGDVCAIDDIYRSVWNENPYCVRKTVVEHIRRIRSKIEPDPHNPCYIKVVFGIGYKMEKAG